MKRITIVLILASLLTIPVTAQDVTDIKEVLFNDYAKSFVDFAEGAASALPFNTTVGLNWSDAYIGKFPRFGVGLTVGTTLMPYSAFSGVAETLDVNLVDAVPIIETFGAPIPAYTLDARLGGFFLPFDVGFKIGFLPEDAKAFVPPNVTLDYLLVGGDVRIALLKERKGLIPDLSVGIGYNYLKGSVGMVGIVGKTIDITNIGKAPLPVINLSLKDPNLTFGWTANAIDLKVQLSKKILIFTPSVGLGVAFGSGQAGGGLETEVLVDGEKITDEDIKNITEAAEAADQVVPDVTPVSVSIFEESTGTSVRVFGGASVSLFFLKIDLCGMYNFTSKTLGGSVNARVQFGANK